MSDSIASAAAEEIADMVSRWEGGGTRVSPESFLPIIQRALSSHTQALQGQVEELRKGLDEAIKWIEHAPEDTWGYGNTEDARWPLRDELTSKLRSILAAHRGEMK